MKCIQLNCDVCFVLMDMLVGYSKIGYWYLFLPPACIRGPAFICQYRPRPRLLFEAGLLFEARPLIESRPLFEDLWYIVKLYFAKLSQKLKKDRSEPG